MNQATPIDIDRAKQSVVQRLQRLQELVLSPLNTPRRLYLAGLGLLMSTAACGGSTALFFVVFLAGLSVIAWGLLMEIWMKLKALWALTIVHKAVSVLAGILITIPATILAHHAVNRATGLPPDTFTSSISLLTVAYYIPVVAYLGAFALSTYALWQLAVLLPINGFRSFLRFLGMFVTGEPPKFDHSKSLLLFGRLIASIALIGALSYIEGIYVRSDGTIKSLHQWLVVWVDYYDHSPCSATSIGDRVAFLSDNRISVARREQGRWRFDVHSCQT
jgi:hypothetical protein